MENPPQPFDSVERSQIVPLAGPPEENLPLLTMLPSEMLEMVIENLSLDDMKNLRLVNQRVKKFTTENILKRDICGIQFAYDATNGRFYHNKKQEATPLPIPASTLPALTQCMENSKKFPCTDFQFSGGHVGLDVDPDVANFFTSQNARIKGLSIWFTSGDNNSKSSAVLELLHRLPNLETLDLGGILNDRGSMGPTTPSGEGRKDEEMRDSSMKKTYEKLKFLTIKSSVSINENVGFISDLLSRAPNLESGEISLDPASIRNVDLFIDSNKLHLINEMTFEPSSRAENLEFYAKFADAIATLPSTVQLTQLVIFANQINRDDDALQKRAMEILTKILHSSKNSLTSLVLHIPTGFLRLMTDWGELDHVTFLAAYFQTFSSNLQDYLMFPLTSCDFVKMFPQLVSVSLGGRPLFNEVEQGTILDENYFPFSIGTLPTVQRLHLMLNLPSSWLKIFPKTFSNVSCLLINDIQNFQEMSEIIWNFNCLTNMELEILVGDQWSPINSYPTLDAAFTGLPTNTCLIMGERRLDPYQIEDLRMNPSILNLKGLRDLKIAFKDQDERTKDSYQLLAGSLTGELAFRMMDTLRVSILVTAKIPLNIQRMEASLQSLRSYSYVGALGNPLFPDD